MKLQLIDYFDVWGNEEEGWEVNNLAKTDIFIEIDSIRDDEVDILIKLVEAGYLKPQALKEVCIHWLEENFIEIESLKGYPIGRLEGNLNTGKGW